MLQFKAPYDLNHLPDSHPAYPLVQDLINRLIVNFLEERPFYPHWVVSGNASSAPLYLVSGLGHEQKFGDAGRTVR